MATAAIPYQHLSEVLATDDFFVRAQLTDEQWEHFLRTAARAIAGALAHPELAA